MKIIKIHPLPKPITASVKIPGSKSYTNRALLLAAFTGNKVVIKNPLISDDTLAMMKCLRTFGYSIIQSKNSIIVEGNIKSISDKTYKLNAHLSGTTFRFLLAFCCIVPGTKILTGDEGLNKRPIGILVEALRQLGANIEYLDKEGFPPVKINSSGLAKHIVRIPGNISSQYFSALLMIAPVMNGLKIRVEGKQTSKPYIDMTIDTMKSFQVHALNNQYKSYFVETGQAYGTKEYTVEGDFSSAGYFIAIALLTKSRITIRNINPESAQADRELLVIAKKMGAVVKRLQNTVEIKGNGVKALTVDMTHCPDQAQTVAVLAAFAQGKTIIKGVHTLRIKETERIKAVQKELAKMSINTEATDDTLTIHGGNPKPAQISTYSDHRMAMSFAVAGTILPGLSIENPEVVNKTFPEFWKKLREMGVRIEEIRD